VTFDSSNIQFSINIIENLADFASIKLNIYSKILDSRRYILIFICGKEVEI